MWLWVFYRGKKDLPHLLVRGFIVERNQHAPYFMCDRLALSSSLCVLDLANIGMPTSSIGGTALLNRYKALLTFELTNCLIICDCHQI